MNVRSPLSRWLSSLATFGGNAVVQAAGLVIFARTLGPAEYAVVVLAAATAAVAGEFVGLGAGDLLIREVSRDNNAHRREFGYAIWSVALTLLPVTLAASLVAWKSFDVAASLWVLLVLIFSEVVAARTSFMAEQIAIAHHATHKANAVRIFAILTRFLMVCVAVFFAGVTTASGWAVYALISSIIIAAGSITMSAWRFGPPDLKDGPGRWRHIGILFSLMQIIRAVQFSLDRFGVAAVAPLATVGAFGVASRASQLGIMPASAITRITYPLFFKKGADGLGAAFSFGMRIAPAVVAIGLLSSAALAVVAMALPIALGPAYAASKNFLLMLALMPLASALQNLAGDILSGADFQKERVVAGGIGLILACVTVFVGAHWHGVTGAVVGYMVGQFLAAAAGWAMVAALRRAACRTAPGMSR